MGKFKQILSEGVRVYKPAKPGKAYKHPLEGHPYHSKTDAELHYIIRDAGEAARAMQGHSPKSENKYLDQVNDASTILHHRRTRGVHYKPKNEETEVNEFANIDKNLKGTGKHVGYGHGDVFHIQKSNGGKSPWYSAVGQKTKKVFTGPSLKAISQKLGEETIAEDKEKLRQKAVAAYKNKGRIEKSISKDLQKRYDNKYVGSKLPKKKFLNKGK